MNKGRTIITVIVAVLVVAATGHADMRPVCPPDASVQTARSCDQLNPLRYGPLSPFGPFGIPYTGPRSAGYPAEAQPDIGQTHRAQPLRILANEQDTLSFCLYSLLGLGLLKSAPYVKRLSLGVVPGWYHDGGPFQIGHSLAISPDCLSLCPVCCFIQPEGRCKDPMPQYRHETIASLWRKSQFTPAVLAPRGPPSMSKSHACALTLL